MVTLSEAQMKQVEYLISQSIIGNQILFDTATVRKAYSKTLAPHSPYTEKKTSESSTVIELHIEKLLALPTLAQKRTYVENLDAHSLELVIRTYFNIVENNLSEKEPTLH